MLGQMMKNSGVININKRGYGDVVAKQAQAGIKQSWTHRNSRSDGDRVLPICFGKDTRLVNITITIGRLMKQN